MLTILPFPSMTGTRTERIKTFRFTLTDDSVIRKKLKASIAAKDDKPRVNIFEDDTFTVGEEPTVYKPVASADGDEKEWLVVFKFKAVFIEYEDIESTDDTDITVGDNDEEQS